MCMDKKICKRKRLETINLEKIYILIRAYIKFKIKGENIYENMEISKNDLLKIF